MSDISVSFNVQVSKGNYDRSFNEEWSADFTASKVLEAPATQTIGTSEEAVTLVDVSTPGLAILKNLDETNFIEIGVKPAATFYPFLKLAAGESNIVYFAAGVVPYAKADTASANLQAAIYEV